MNAGFIFCGAYGVMFCWYPPRAQGRASIRADIQAESVLSPLFTLSMTERISEGLQCQMGDCSFMGNVCETPWNMSALSALKHTKHFLRVIPPHRRSSLSHLCCCKLYLRPAASSTRGRNNRAHLRRLPSLRYVNVWNIVILRHGST